jgi:hypothetical protein
MKKIILLATSFVFTLVSFAQEKIILKSPTPSPEAIFEQEIGSTKIKVTYARPLARGRKIFGDVVPMDSLWRTGASEATTLSTNEEIIFGDKTLAAGRYAIFTIPSKSSWTIIVNTDTTLHGNTGYDAKKDVYRFIVPSEKINNFYETFTIELNDINDKGEGYLKLIWENTLVKIALKSKADEKIMALIQKHIIQDKMQDADLLFQSASYYYSTKRYSKLAVKWLYEAEKSDAENFYYPNLRQKILADLKDYPAAIEAAKKAVVLGEKKKMTNSVNNLKKRIEGWELWVNKK